jgi:hypothetical protein
MYVRKQDEAAEIRASKNYKLVRSGHIIYVFPEDAKFENFTDARTLQEWSSNAVLVIDNRTGETRKNRFGPVSQVNTLGETLQ